MIVFCVAFDLFCIGLGIWAFVETGRCKKAIKGTFITTNRYSSKSVTFHAPIFRYEVGGDSFQVQTMQSFTKRYIQKNFEFGKEYTIFIDEKRPRFFVIKKSSGVKYLIFVFIGMFFLVLTLGAR